MARVTAIRDGRTIEADLGGKREVLTLAGVEVIDELRASELLRWTIGSSWVMAERSGDGWRVYRSPDALFVNAELVLRGFARPTAPGIVQAPQAMVTYLGELNLQAPEKKASSPKTAAPKKEPAGKKVSPPSRRQSGSGTSRRSTAPPSPRARAPRPSVPN